MSNDLIEQLVDKLNSEAWDEWLEYRKAKRKPVSPLAAKKVFKWLLDLDPEDQQKVIDRSIENDWQGLFPPPSPQTRSVALRRDGGAVSTRERTIEEDLLDRSWAD